MISALHVWRKSSFCVSFLNMPSEMRDDLLTTSLSHPTRSTIETGRALWGNFFVEVIRKAFRIKMGPHHNSWTSWGGKHASREVNASLNARKHSSGHCDAIVPEPLQRVIFKNQNSKQRSSNRSVFLLFKLKEFGEHKSQHFLPCMQVKPEQNSKMPHCAYLLHSGFLSLFCWKIRNKSWNFIFFGRILKAYFRTIIAEKAQCAPDNTVIKGNSNKRLLEMTLILAAQAYPAVSQSSSLAFCYFRPCASHTGLFY